ncbi:MAG: hypothetical protein KDI82_13005, partial [Gammaproteobacteria bacterium]|nr:hypothetical protein [Gammaproteobacteria bacterium]
MPFVSRGTDTAACFSLARNHGDHVCVPGQTDKRELATFHQVRHTAVRNNSESQLGLLRQQGIALPFSA